MYTKIRSFFFFLFIFSLQQIAFSQKAFQVTLEFPPQVDVRNIKIAYDDGKENFSIKEIKSNKITISRPFYSKYATIAVSYPKSTSTLHSSDFFLTDQPASIIFQPQNNSQKNPLSNPLLRNAQEVAETYEAKMLNAFSADELDDFISYLEKNDTAIATNEDLANIFNEKFIRLNLKQLAYVEKHGADYYSFWLFRTQLLENLKDAIPDTLLKVFNSVFPEELRNSIEGLEVQKYLNGILFAKKNYSAPHFQAKDITGKKIDLGDYKNQYVLLNFWASWCGPCMAEVPLINKLRKKYSKEQLVIIGVSYDSDSAACTKAIKTHQMNWVHIFGNNNIRKMYGDKPIPLLYLVDKNGIIIYSNWEDGYDNLETLLDARIVLAQ